MIPYGKQYIDIKDLAAVQNVLKSSHLTQGPGIGKFEKKLARACNRNYAAVTNSGTSALHLAYVAAGIGAGDEVITTPNTFVATSNMILACGARPVFCDIRLDTYNIDESKIEKLITKKTKAIVPVHFAGHPCDMSAIMNIARKHKLLVIEDACHALGAKYKHKKIGGFGNVTVFSFHPVKPITTGEGGVAVTNSRALYRKLVLLRSHGIHKDNLGRNVMTMLGYNYRMTDIQASLGISQLKKLNEFIRKRHRIAKWYEEELKDIRDIILPQELPGNYSGWHIYVIRTKTPRVRRALFNHLKKSGVGVNLHYPAVYAHPYYRNNGYKNAKLPHEEEYAETCITIPCYPTLKKNQVVFVSKTIKEFFNV